MRHSDRRTSQSFTTRINLKTAKALGAHDPAVGAGTGTWRSFSDRAALAATLWLALGWIRRIVSAALLTACGPERDVRDGCDTVKRWRRLDASTLGALVVVAAALALRLSAVGFGKGSLTLQIDEDFNIPLALRMSWAHPNPHYFEYPALLWDLLFGLDRVVSWLLREDGVVRPLGELFQQTPIPFFLLGRTISVMAGTAAVGGVYLLGRRLFSPTHGLLAAAFLAGTFLHVRDSALATPDALTSACVALGLLGATAVLRQGRRRDYVLAGVGAAVAASAKYDAAVVIFAVVVAHAFVARRGGTPLHRVLVSPRLLVTVVVAGAVFLTLNPYLLLDTSRVMEDLTSIAERVREGQCIGVCFDAGIGWRYHLALSLRYGMGLLLLGLAIVGMLLALWRREAAGWLLLGFAVPFYAAHGSTRLVFARYMTPLLPVLCLFAAVGVCAIAARVSRPRLRVAVVVGLSVLALIEPLSAAAAYIKLVRREDTRLTVYEFLETLPPGTRVASYGPRDVWGSTIPRIRVEMWPKRDDETWTQYVARERTSGVEYVLAHYSALEVFSPAIPELERVLRQSATLVLEVSPYEANVTPHPVYDWLDPHYFPMGRFQGIRHSGPLVRVYRLGFAS
jgi:hypothetical protein